MRTRVQVVFRHSAPPQIRRASSRQKQPVDLSANILITINKRTHANNVFPPRRRPWNLSFWIKAEFSRNPRFSKGTAEILHFL